jgi:hypothetical protein
MCDGIIVNTFQRGSASFDEGFLVEGWGLEEENWG